MPPEVPSPLWECCQACRDRLLNFINALYRVSAGAALHSRTVGEFAQQVALRLLPLHDSPAAAF